MKQRQNWQQRPLMSYFPRLLPQDLLDYVWQTWEAALQIPLGLPQEVIEWSNTLAKGPEDVIGFDREVHSSKGILRDTLAEFPGCLCRKRSSWPWPGGWMSLEPVKV